MREMFRRIFAEANYEIVTARNGREGLALFEAGPVHLVVTDLNMPELNGMEVLRAVKARNPDLPVVIVTAFGTIETAVQAIKQGAYDYITKPFDPDDIEITVKNALAHQRLADENRRLKERLRDAERPPDMVGTSPKMQEVFHLIDKVAPTDATVLIQGESGTGKELVARRLQHLSPRRDQTFLSINCAALPEGLLESELFGYERGAFTGATRAREGLFRTAHKGTLFLDEIGEMAPALQAKLLRVLQDKEVLALGGRKPVRVDVRILAATNKNLKEEVDAGRFREDLYYRINIFAIQVPPLRERPEDIPLLVSHFMRRYNREFAKSVESVSPELMDFFLHYAWPGNIRELQNYVERAVLMAEGRQLELSAIPREALEAAETSPAGEEFLPFKEAKERFEREYLTALLRRYRGVVTRAARAAKIPRPNLYEKMKKHGIVPKKR